MNQCGNARTNEHIKGSKDPCLSLALSLGLSLGPLRIVDNQPLPPPTHPCIFPSHCCIPTLFVSLASATTKRPRLSSAGSLLKA